MDEGLLQKDEDKEYSLTTRGKQFAQMLDTDNFEMEKQAKIGVAISAMREENGIKEYLIQERCKEPYFGYFGFMTGKIKWGETIFETAAREFQEEMGIEATFRLIGVKHKMDYSEEQYLLEDKYFFIFLAENLSGEVIQEFEGGKNHWCTREELEKNPRVFHGVLDHIQWMETQELHFSEMKVTVSEY